MKVRRRREIVIETKETVLVEYRADYPVTPGDEDDVQRDIGLRPEVEEHCTLVPRKVEGTTEHLRQIKGEKPCANKPSE